MLFSFLLANATVSEPIEEWFSYFVELLEKVLFWKVIGPFPLIVLTLMVGAITFTLVLKFINLRGFFHSMQIVRGVYDDPDAEGEINSFQALTSALSATIGLGNIAGVAVAIATGGAGAVFWMMSIALFGMTSKFVSSSLAQFYRRVDEDGTVLGGPMYYLKFGLKERGLGWLGSILSVMFAIFIIGGSFGGGNMFQANQSFELMQAQFPVLEGYGLYYGIALAVLVGAVILGGIKSIGTVTEKLVPLMVILYFLASLYIIILHINEIPALISDMISQAFQPQTRYDAIYGGFLGVLVIGIQRAAFSNEAGVGSSAIAHSAAKTAVPIREGFVAMLEPFFDTIIVCFMTASVLLITQNDNADLRKYQEAQDHYAQTMISYNQAVERNADQAHIQDLEKLKIEAKEALPDLKGAKLTSNAFSSKISWFPYVLTIVVFLFSYSTMISWYYYGSQGWMYLFGRGGLMLYQVFFLTFVVIGCIASLDVVISFSDMMILSCAFPNIIGGLIMLPKVREELNSYMEKLQNNEFETFS